VSGGRLRRGAREGVVATAAAVVELAVAVVAAERRSGGRPGTGACGRQPGFAGAAGNAQRGCEFFDEAPVGGALLAAQAVIERRDRQRPAAARCERGQQVQQRNGVAAPRHRDQHARPGLRCPRAGQLVEQGRRGERDQRSGRHGSPTGDRGGEDSAHGPRPIATVGSESPPKGHPATRNPSDAPSTTGGPSKGHPATGSPSNADPVPVTGSPLERTSEGGSPSKGHPATGSPVECTRDDREPPCVHTAAHRCATRDIRSRGIAAERRPEQQGGGCFRESRGSARGSHRRH
jgi:hypothetical protein